MTTHAEQVEIVDNAVAAIQPDAPMQSNNLPTASTQQMIASIGQMAMNPDVDVEKMDKLLNIQLTMMDRQAKIDFDLALARVQADMPRITERGQIKNKNQQVVATYLKYEDIDLQIRPLLQKEGFSLIHNRAESNNKMIVRTTLKHCGGHEESVEIPLPYDQANGMKSAIQAAVSTYSYGKRVNVCSLLNIVAQGEDDDAQLASCNAITAEQAKGIKDRLRALYESGKEVNTVGLLKYLGAKDVDSISVSKYEEALSLIAKKEAQE